MRSDLAKCTTEQGRAGGYGKIKFGGKVRIHPDPDHDYPKEFGGFKSSARHRHFNHKEFTDVLGPLHGAIRKNVGRPWNDVFSEFCQVLDRRSMAGYHIWTHLRDEVTTHTFMENGVVMEKPKYGGPTKADGFYVHPLTGILCHKEQEWKRRGRREKPPVSIPVPGMEPWKYEQIDGLWFRVLSVKVPDPVHRWKVTHLVTSKRSANRKEIAWIKTVIGGAE